MRVRMKTHITGFRNGVEWPAKGTVIEIADHEGADLCAAGLAEEAPDADAEFIAPTFFADPDSGAVYQSAVAPDDDPGDGEDATDDTGDGAGTSDDQVKSKRGRKAAAE